MKSGKIWGETAVIFGTENFELHRIEVLRYGFCSKHKHAFRWNAFYVESGKLEISIWSNEYPLIDKTTLVAGESLVVPPGVSHQFFAHEDTIAFEAYWVKLSGDDIIRETVGGRSDE